MLAVNAYSKNSLNLTVFRIFKFAFWLQTYIHILAAALYKQQELCIHVDQATQLDTDNSAPSFTRVSSTSSTSYSLTTSTLDPGKLYKVTIVLTSQKTASNTLTKTFRVAKK